MQLAFSPRAQFATLAVVNAIAISVASAQGPAPSPLISAPSPPPANIPAVAPQTSPAPELTKADFETFLDALIPSQLRNRKIAGAVVSVVKDGQVLFQKGYGYADVEEKKPVLPDQTLFRPGSISKLFTATAVMQLVERGKLDLDRDVNDYLDFRNSENLSRAGHAATVAYAHGRIRGNIEESFRRARKRHQTVAHVSRERNARSYFPAGQSSVLFQLWIHARRIHRRACERRKVRALHRQSHFEAAAG